MPETDVPQTDDPETDDPETDVPETEGRDGHPRDGWHRRVSQTDGPGRKSLDGRVLRFHGFSSQGHPSVPLVLAVPVSETDGAETDVPETEEGRLRRMSPRRRKAARDGCHRDGCPRHGRCAFSSITSDLRECDCFFFFHLSVWFQRY